MIEYRIATEKDIGLMMSSRLEIRFTGIADLPIPKNAWCLPVSGTKGSLNCL